MTSPRGSSRLSVSVSVSVSVVGAGGSEIHVKHTHDRPLHAVAPHAARATALSHAAAAVSHHCIADARSRVRIHEMEAASVSSSGDAHQADVRWYYALAEVMAS